MSVHYFVAQLVVHLAQDVRRTREYGTEPYVIAVDHEVVARSILAATDEHHAEQARWRGRTEERVRRQRLVRAMTPGVRGPRPEPRLA